MCRFLWYRGERIQINISNKLVDYTIVYDERKEVNSGKYEQKKIIIEEAKKIFQKEVENRIGREVIVVYDWRRTHSGIEIILYAYECWYGEFKVTIMLWQLHSLEG